MSSYNYFCIIRIEIKCNIVEEKVRGLYMAQPWFEPCVSADDNVYLKLENDEHRNEYYSYIVLYMGDVVCIHKEPDKYLNFFDRYFCPKDPPE